MNAGMIPIDGQTPVLSIVIPMRNEAGNAEALVSEILSLAGDLPPFEVIVTDDGSTDGTADIIRRMGGADPRLRLLRHPASAGQSAAIHSGVLAARGGIIATLDGDGQNPPGELPALIAPLLADGAGRVGLVAGQRVGRKDTWSKRVASKVANALRSRVLGDGTRDTGCGLKAFRHDAFLRLPYFDHMHRFLPALFKRDGWDIALVDVAHRPRIAGQSNYTNLQRAAVGVIDLIGVAWLIRRRKKAQVQDLSEPSGNREEWTTYLHS